MEFVLEKVEISSEGKSMKADEGLPIALKDKLKTGERTELKWTVYLDTLRRNSDGGSVLDEGLEQEII